MTLLPRALSLCIPLCRASLPSCNGTTIPILDVSASPSSCNTRTLWDIILSCALTLFACTWTAVHPNIPGIEEGIIAITSRRLFLMVMALIAPELMITWSARQFFSARDAAEEFKSLGVELQRPASQANGNTQAAEAISDGHNAGEDPEDTALLLEGPQSHERNSSDPCASRAHNVQSIGSTMTRRLFARMGRFLPYQNNKPNSLDPKGWALTHGFFAWMGGFLLCKNNKPVVILTPYELIDLILSENVDMPIITEEEIKDRSKGDVLSKGIAILQLVWFIVQLAARYAQSLPISLLEIDTLAVAGLTCIAYGLWWKKPKDVGRPYVMQWKATGYPQPTRDTFRFKYQSEDLSVILDGYGYFSYVMYPFVSLAGTDPIVLRSDVRSHRAPYLGGYAVIHGGTICLIGCISGILFGGIHCMGWNYLFQGQMAWRLASLSIFCAPVCTLIFYSLKLTVFKINIPSFLRILMLIIPPIVYVIARIGLIVLMLMSLRSLPPGAYDTVTWTKFIPHYQ